MALRLRKDVQKASYYVWFLGAEEARGLRGPRIVISAIPYLVERSRELEPIKVTLQVSHKGMKIVQGSSKHFITHSAITCAVQSDDIVACILLLYNPITKCPLHVHAYRCDSESTAQALHQQLQVLINRPENQKRFSELETRLGLLAGSPTGRNPLPPTKPVKEKAQRSDDRQVPPNTIKRFDSSLGSDTGTSTRESECSEEHTPVSPLSPISSTKASLYDSLAAELRAKLNGNGPPLLLPPRDYDTVHRSKGNLAATELRRCRNTLIVGGPGSKYGVSSRGSSGIGSDLAPSPERHEAQSSSDEDWLEKKRRSDEHMNNKSVRRPVAKKQFGDEEKVSPERSPEQPPSYLYPLQKQAYVIPSNTSSNPRLDRISYAKDDNRLPAKEEEIKPKLMRPRNLEAHFKQILSEKQFVPSDEMDDDDQDFNDDVERFRNDSVKYVAERNNEKNMKIHANDSKHLQRTKSAPIKANDDDYRYRHREPVNEPAVNGKLSKYRTDEEIEDEEITRYRENLTDKQKYRESLIERQRNVQNMYRERQLNDGFRAKEQPISTAHETKGPYKHSPKYDSAEYEPQEPTIDRKAYRHQAHALPNYDDIDFSRNPYKEPESLPYRQSIDRMMKSPAMRYKSFEDSGYRDVEYDEECLSEEKHRFGAYPLTEKYREMRISQYPNEDYNNGKGGMYEPDDRISSRQRYKEMKQRSQSRSPDTVMRVPPRERFQNAKEKFKAIERDRPYVVDKVIIDRPYVAEKIIDRPYVVEKLSDRPYMVEKIKNSHRLDGGGRHEQHEPISHLNTRHLPPRQDPMLDWSSDEEQFGRGEQPTSMTHHRPQQQSPAPPNGRIVPREHYEKNMQSRMASSKSLGNLVKGYRHSYAEPRNPMPRNSGRVGLAAVNPY